MPLKRLIFIFLFFTSFSCSKKSDSGTPPVNQYTTFTNPLLTSGPDPWVFQKDTTYYYTHTFGDRIVLYKTNKMSDLNKANVTTIWSPPSTGLYSKEIWAPEVHYLQGKWYVYFAADDGNNNNHRIYVLENSSADPLAGTWQLKGKIADSSDKWAIDASVFEYGGQLYFIWSGWEGDTDGRQDIYIAKMTNPWTISGPRVMISTPTYNWEKIGSPPTVNEGPEVIRNASGKIFLTYSASGCWSDDYSIGMLTLKDGGDPLVNADWTKSNSPVFTKKPENYAYAPGHNGFFKSRDGKEDWIIYHANSSSGEGCGNSRNPRMQKFTWNTDGTPNFGEPARTGTPLKVPSGE